MGKENPTTNRTEYTSDLSRTIFLPMGAPPLAEIISLDSTPVIKKTRTVKNAAEPLLIAEGIVELKLRYIIYRETSLTEMDWEETVNELVSAAQDMSCEATAAQKDENTVTISFPWEISMGFPQLAPRNFSPIAACRKLRYSIASPRAVELGMELVLELYEKISAPEIRTEIQPEESSKLPTTANKSQGQKQAAPIAPVKEMPVPPRHTAKTLPIPATEPAQENTAAKNKSFPHNSYKMKFYRVKESDTLWNLADKFGVSANFIAEINGLGNMQLTAGMFINLPVPR